LNPATTPELSLAIVAVAAASISLGSSSPAGTLESPVNPGLPGRE
jgi:hypothetical protein